jgi:hypothetical protein
MNRNCWIVSLAAIGSLFLLAYMGGLALAQEEEMLLEHKDVFGKLKRPPVPFPHELHTDVLADEGCGVCHHVYDEEKGTLVPDEDPDEGCAACHGAKKEGNQPGLREAFHGSCTVCHRKMAKEGKETGPRTCGECHKK